MSKTKTLVKRGVVGEFGGKFWGIQYEDGHSTSYAFGPIENARMSDPKYCTRPIDMTYKGSHYVSELSKAKLRKVVRTTTYEVW